MVSLHEKTKKITIDGPLYDISLRILGHHFKRTQFGFSGNISINARDSRNPRNRTFWFPVISSRVHLSRLGMGVKLRLKIETL